MSICYDCLKLLYNSLGEKRKVLKKFRTGNPKLTLNHRNSIVKTANKSSVLLRSSFARSNSNLNAQYISANFVSIFYAYVFRFWIS